MSSISRVWESLFGNSRGKKPGNSHKSRSLRMESLEDRALLSVTPEALDVSFGSQGGGALEAAAAIEEAAIPLTAAQAGAAGQTVTVAATDNDALANEVVANEKLATPVVVVDNVEGYTITFHWDPIVHADHYWVRYFYTSSSGQGQIDPVDIKDCSYTFTVDLGPMNYRVDVMALDSTKTYESSKYGSSVFYALPKQQTLDPPDPQIKSAVESTVIVSWEPVDHADYYWVSYYFDDGQVPPIYSQEQKTTDCSYTFEPQDGPGKYTFLVRACSNNPDAYPDSGSGNTETITLPFVPKLDAPKPTASAAVQGNNVSITVSWEPVSDAAGYTLQYKKTTEDDSCWVTVANLTETSYTIENLARETSYDIQVKAVAEAGSQQEDSDYSDVITVITPLADWYLMDYADYTKFRIDAGNGTAYLYGISKDGQKVELRRASITAGVSITLYSDNVARDVMITEGALRSFGEIIYVGGKTKNDTIWLEGNEGSDIFTMNQETRSANVYTKDGKSTEQNVVFETVYIEQSVNQGIKQDLKQDFKQGLDTNDRTPARAAMVKMSGISSVALDANTGSDTFKFIKFGTTYDLIGSDIVLNFTDATSGVKLDLGKTKAQSVLSGQKGKLCLHDNVLEVYGSRFNDKITTAASTKKVAGYGGSDTVKLVGDKDTETYVSLNGDSQKVTGKGGGLFRVTILEGTKSTVNMSSVKDGRMILNAVGNKVRVTGTKGKDTITVSGDDAKVRGGDGDDRIVITGANAKASGDKGNDVLDLRDTYGKCVLDGGAGDDFLIAGTGNDTLKGQSGNNILIGGTGADKITGGRGRDCLVANTTEALAKNGTLLRDLIMRWMAEPGNVDMVVERIGKVSIADFAADVLKGGGGTGNYFYANMNPKGNDFDTADYKADKGDILYTDLDVLGEREL